MTSSYTYGNFIVTRNCDRLVSILIDKLESKGILTTEVKGVVESMYSTDAKSTLDKQKERTTNINIPKHSSKLRDAIEKKTFLDGRNNSFRTPFSL
jgi:hypothetical protein